MEQTVIQKTPKIRKSGVELLKIFGILLVVLSHVEQTLCTQFDGFSYKLDIETPTSSVIVFIIAILRYSGVLGNSIFFICSAWFLLDSNKTNTQKILRMAGDVWIISVIWLLTSLLIPGIIVDGRLLLSSLLPIIKQSNWYISNYIVFCFIYPFLNIIIKNIDKNKHLIIALILSLLFIVSNFIFGLPPCSSLVLWISIYFVISYFKIYALDFCKNKKANIILLIVGIVGNLATIIITNIVGLTYPDLSLSLLSYLSNGNIFALIFSFSLLNLFMRLEFTNKFVNLISSLSLLVYVIHENILFRELYRTKIWQWIYNIFGHNYVLLWVIIYTILLFIVSCLVALIYKSTLQKLVHFIADKIHQFLTKLYNLIISFGSKTIN